MEDQDYSQVTIPSGRSKANKPFDQLTNHELFNRFQNVEGRRGKYTVADNRLTRRFDATTNPGQKGTEQVQQFRIEGDVLILTGAKAEARLRRVISRRHRRMARMPVQGIAA